MRPPIHEWAMNLAKVVATRSTCCRRHVGCVLLNIDHHIIATGYNGVAAGVPHCNELRPGLDHIQEVSNPVEEVFPHACEGAQLPSGQGLDLCEAIHAEQNALLQCHDVREVYACYTTTSPCVTCTKLLLNTGCQHIFFVEEYVQPAARSLWLKSNRMSWKQV